MHRYEKLAAIMRDAVEHPDKYPEMSKDARKENNAKDETPGFFLRRGTKPISGADAMARWEAEHEDDGKKSRVDRLREKHDGHA